MMICESCKKNEATVHLTQVVDDEVKKVHLCESCANESGVDTHSPISITDLLLGVEPEGETIKPGASSCPVCKIRRSDFKKSGRLGCGHCYEVFKDELQALIKAMHNADRHMGKVPERHAMAIDLEDRINRFQAALDRAVAEENFEEAARLRDLIKQQEQRMAARPDGESA
jgi:protein arginine kinase activator